MKGNIYRFYNKEGDLHREDGPALFNDLGTMFWYQDGELHREDGPAVVFAGGRMIWYIRGSKIKDTK